MNLMKVYSNKGITMMSLIIYITSFLVVVGVVAGITSFFYGNASLMTQELYSSSDYNKLNLYLVKESEQVGNRVSSLNSENGILSFTNGDKFTYDKTNKLLYYNSICLCEDIQNFSTNTEYTDGKEVINVNVEFTNRSYSCKYTMAQ